MALAKKDTPASTDQKSNGNQAKAWANWNICFNDGTEYSANKGFPIFQNPQYPNVDEDVLVQMAQENGGEIELTMRVVVRINNGSKKPSVAEMLKKVK